MLYKFTVNCQGKLFTMTEFAPTKKLAKKAVRDRCISLYGKGTCTITPGIKDNVYGSVLRQRNYFR